jgi:hypothetical protein
MEKVFGNMPGKTKRVIYVNRNETPDPAQL